MTYRQAGCGPCGGCGSSVQAECGDRCLDINYDPANNCVVYFTKDGCSAPFDGTKMVQCAETDTRLELDRDGCDIRFYSERYYTAGTSPQAINIHDLGGCIALGDLANVAETANHPDHCSFLVYKKSADCGDGCEGKDDAWQPWSPLKNKADGLHYVMGLNDDGCPITLNDPTGSFGNNSNDKYWWAMWRPDGQFGYIQPEKRDSLPTDDNGNPLVISQDPNGKPIVAPLDRDTDDIVYHTIARTSLVVEHGYYGQTDFEIRIDSKEGNDGTMEAPDDMIAFVNFCADYSGSTAVLRTITVTVGENTDNFDEDYIRDRGRHFQQSTTDWAVPGSIAVVVHKGNHLKFHSNGVAGDDDLPHFRVHQVDVVWMRLHQYREYRK